MSASGSALPLYGHAEVEAEFLSARDSDRLHHAWIFEGPSGIGKSRSVLRLASILLGAKPIDDDPAGALEDDPVMQKILSSGHPDLKHVTRELNDKGALKQDISVDQIRELNSFFSLKPALGGWRVGIIDSLDEMNANGLNAVLKTLEEPPDRAILFLISHATQAVLPTIRSRCQSLKFRSLGETDTLAMLRENGVENPEAMLDLVKGRPGRAGELSGAKVMAAANSAQTLLKALPNANEAVVANAILTASEDEASFRAFSGLVLDWLRDRGEQSSLASNAWFEAQNIIAAHRQLHMTNVQSAAKLVNALQSSFENR